MIIQHAVLSVAPGKGAEFESAFKEAEKVIASAAGFQFVDLLRGVSEKETYLLIVSWNSADDDLTGFRTSALYQKWNELLGTFFSAEPEYSHFEVLSHYTG